MKISCLVQPLFCKEKWKNELTYCNSAKKNVSNRVGLSFLQKAEKVFCGTSFPLGHTNVPFELKWLTSRARLCIVCGKPVP